jgi:methionine biosynthesis protein MetW
MRREHDRQLATSALPQSDMQSVADKIYINNGNQAVIDRVPATARNVLDVGCGNGANARLLAARGMSVDGITLSPQEAQVAERICRRVFTHNLEHGLPYLDGELYDAVICSHVLEHICQPTKLLDDITGALREGAPVIVALPNLLWWRNRAKLMLGRFDYQPFGIMDDTHFRWYTFKTAQELLRQHGFTVTEASGDGCFPLGPIRRRLPANTFLWLDRLCLRALPGLFGYQMLFVAHKQRGYEQSEAPQTTRMATMLNALGSGDEKSRIHSMTIRAWRLLGRRPCEPHEIGQTIAACRPIDLT